MAKATISKGVKTKTTWANALKRDWQLYLLLMIPVALVVIFNYASYGGIRMVFMDYKPAKGYAGSKWVGWATFQKVFKDKDFIRALKSSIVFNLLDLAVGFPMPIILALILNELRFPRFKKVTQTILYLPHFLSWVIVGSVAYQMFRPTTGMVNIFLMNAGIIQNGIPFLTEKWHWAVTYLLIGVWQGMGWGTVQSHVNVIAVAVLMEMACVILVEDVQPEEATLAKAKEEGLPVLSTDKTAYEVCGMMNQAGIAPPVN